MEKSDHWHVGAEHAAQGLPRYKFQDPHLQAQYDEGYDGMNRLREVGSINQGRVKDGDSLLATWRRVRGRTPS